MAKGGRKYNRDSRGRFASSGGGGGKSAGKASKPAASSAPKGSGRGKSKAAEAPKAANKVSASPRRLTKAEQAYMEIKAQKSKFRSDKKVREEMQRRGFLKSGDPQGELIKLAYNARAKKGQNTPEMNAWW
jgi:hypothetical protein